MKDFTFLFIIILTLVGRFQNLYAQQDTLPLAPETFTSIYTTEGTFMNLDVSSKDGSIVFELLGNIFLLPKQGGVPRQLTYGISWDSYPIFSPNGDSIAFISDRTGSRAIFTMNTDGSNLKKVESNDDFNLDAIYWLDQPRNTTPVIEFEYLANKIPVKLSNQDLMHIDHSNNIAYYKTDNGVEALSVISGVKNNLTNSIDFKNKNIAISPDGNFLALVTKYDIRSKENKTNSLSIIDLRTSRIIVTKKIGRFLQFIPRFAFSEDSKSLVLAYSGKIHRIQLTNGNDSIIPFNATINLAIAPYVYNTFDYSYDKVDVKHFRWYTTSDSIAIVSSLGKLYRIRDASLAPLHQDIEHGQFFPSVHKNKLLYSSWNDKGKGYIWHTDLAGSKPRKVLQESGVYKYPTWLGDTTKIAYISSRRNYERFLEDRQLASLQVYDREHDIVNTIEDRLPFLNSLIYNAKDGEIFYLGDFINEERYKPLYRFNINSNQKEEFARVDIDVDQVAISPDKKFIAFIHKRNLHFADIRNATPPYNLFLGKTDIPIRKISKSGAVDPVFFNNSELRWIWGENLYSIYIEKRIDHLEIQKTSFDLKFGITQTSMAHVYTDARIITMDGDEVIENAVLIVDNGKIEHVGKASDFKLPEDVKMISLKGKTIIPGLIDMHAHDGPPTDILALDWKRYILNLAYGLTTLRDPSQFRDFQAYELLAKMKEILSPRIFGADALTGSEYQIECYEDALAWVQMQKLLGALYIKVHDDWNRKQRQWLVMAAKNQGLNIIGHAGSGVYGGGFYNLSILLDGFTGVEHYIPFGKYYKDLIELFALSKIYSTPTCVGSGGEFGNYKRMITENDSITLIEALNSGSKSFLNISYVKNFVPENSKFKSEVENLGNLQQNNSNILVGSHGDLPGIEFHWEMWSIFEGGISEFDILKSATIKAAEGLGLQNYIGSIEKSKLADFVILNSNPLEDIRATLDIYGIVSDGKFYLQKNLLERLNSHDN